MCKYEVDNLNKGYMTLSFVDDPKYDKVTFLTSGKLFCFYLLLKNKHTI